MKSGTTKALAIVGVCFLCLVMFVGGAGFAVWFSQNFAIVPKAHFVDSLNQALRESESFQSLLGEDGAITEEQLNRLLSEETVTRVMKGEQDLNQLLDDLVKQTAPVAGTVPVERGGSDWTMHPAQRAANKQGAFRFKFTPGETLRYRLTANMTGRGMESIGPGAIDVNLDSALELKTQSVDRDGFGRLQLQFGDTQAKGDFMGGPFYWARGPQGTKLEMNGKTYIDSMAQQGSTAGIPQLEFYDAPIDVEVAPNGVVTAISGDSGMGGLMSAIPMFTDLEFPSEELVEGATWVSHVTMPVPGIGTAIPTTITNTFTGYRTIGNRLCAMIDQQITSEQVHGTITAPGGVFGAAMGFAMPQFKLGGMNKVYFDVENGQLVHSDLDLDLGVEIGNPLGRSGGQFQGLMENLGDILRDVPEFESYGDLLPKSGRNRDKKSNNLLEMNVDIKSQISLVEPAMPMD
jgi:hypothetical protein